MNMRAAHILPTVILGLLSGCLDLDGYEPLQCHAQQSGAQRIVGHILLDDVSPTTSFDYVGLYHIRPSTSSNTAGLVDSSGEPCTHASDVASCEAELTSLEQAAVTLSDGVPLGPESDAFRLIVNHGDEVSVIDTKEGMRAWLGPIDTPAEAVLVARLERYMVYCDEPAIKEVEGGHELVGAAVRCPSEDLDRVQLHVDEQGDVTELSSKRIEKQPGSGACDS